MKKIISLTALTLTACSTTHTIGNLQNDCDPGFLSPSVCLVSAKVDGKIHAQYPVSGPGFLGIAVPSAAMVGSAALIGPGGLAHSGSRINNGSSSGGASSNAGASSSSLSGSASSSISGSASSSSAMGGAGGAGGMGGSLPHMNHGGD